MSETSSTPPVQRAEPSFAQARLWFIDQLRPSTGMSNVPLTIRVRGGVRAEDVRRALGLVVNRHEALRTRFVSDQGIPYQEIHVSVPIDLTTVDLRGEPDGMRTNQELRRLASAAIPLDSLPLFRTQMLIERDGAVVVQLVMHHIITDGWSLGVLRRDLSAALTGSFDDLAPLTSQYRDVAVRQRAEFAQGRYDEDLAYWETALGAPQPLMLPMLGGEPRSTATRGARRSLSLDAQTSARIRAVAARRRLTPNMLMLAAYAATLFRHTGLAGDTVVVGTPTAGRSASGDEHLIGFFVNTLPVPIEVSRSQTVGDYLDGVRASVVGALNHQRAPFERIVERIRPERRLESSPLYQTVFVYQNAPTPSSAFDDDEIEVLDVHNGASPGGLTMSVSERDGGFACRLEYNAEQMSDDLAGRLLRRYRRLLEAMLDGDEDRTIGALPMIDDDERRRTVAAAARSVHAGPTRDLFTAFLRSADRRPDAIAISAEDRSLTYRELARQADGLAGLLMRRGVTAGDWVVVRVRRTSFLPVALLAVLRAGAGYVPLHPGLPLDRARFILDDCRPTAIITERDLEAVAGDGVATVLRDELTAAPAAAVRPSPVDPGTPAYLIYTSGSTGEPKGVPVTHANVVRLFQATDRHMRLDHTDVWSLFHSYAFDFSVWELWGALLHGARCAIVPEATTRRPADLRALLHDEGVTVLSQTPSAFAALDEADARADDALALRYVVLGGERLAPSILAGWSSRHPLDRVRVINMYGITETTVHVTFRTMTPEDLTRPRLSPIGRALDDLDLYLLEPGSTEPAPLGVPGELCVGGAGVALGYLNRPERTAQSFIPHPFVPGEVLYRSGDQGIKLDSTDCFYLGRYDSQVKMRGFRIELGEIESVLLACPGVQRAAVSLADAGTDRARLTAHVVAQLPEAPGRQERGRQWEGIFDAAYSADDGQGRGDFRGWRSSYTGNRIAEEEMDEWAERTVARIRALRPRRVIEIGVGTGLLLTRLLGQVESYTALNVSSEAIERLRSPSAPNLRLLHREATDLDDLPEGGFDTVIINSVVQYFPDAAYTREVIERASRLVAPGGHIFVGDVRDLRSHLTFHRSLALARMAPDAPARRALMEADLSAARDREVVLDPDYFALLAHGNSRLDGAVVRPRLDECVNEMSKYRYDVVLRAAGAGPRSPSVSPEVLEPVDDVDELSRLLGAHRGTALAMRGLVDSRPAQDLTAAGILEEGGASTVAQVRARASGTARGMTPGDALRAATALGRSARVVASREGAGLFDLLVDASPDDELWVPRRVMDPHRLANDPTVAHRQDILIRDLHDQLARKLPEYMLPSDMTVVDEIPLTVNGKTDLEALPRSAETRTARAGLDGADTAPQTATERAVAGIFASMLHLQQVGADADFFALGGHSLLVARFAYAVADELGVALPLRVIFEDSTVRGIARAIDEAASGNRHEPDLMAEAGRWTPPVPAVRTGPAGPARSLLVTGATGFLGAHVLAEALERTDAVVHCVVRARDDTGARERVETALRRYGLAVPERNRMRVCGGDLSQPHLGLTQPAYDRLVDELDLVYHVAADTTLVVPYSRLRETNVEGTSRVLELAAAAAAPVHYVSTVGVFAPTGEVRTEQSPTGPVEGLSTAYAQSKWVAEQRVLRARASGLPVSIYRPARITGSTTTGACRPDDLFWRVVLGAIQLSEVPADPGLRADLVAVDEVAAAIVSLSVGGYVGETYHLSHGAGTSLDAVVRVLRGLGYRLGRTTMDRWLGRLKGEPGNAAASLVPLLDWQGALDVPLSSESTRRALNEVDASLRPVTDEMLARTVEFFIRTGQFPRPGTSRP